MFGWGIESVTTDELAEKRAHGKIVLIDVREPYEFAAGRVKGAVNIPLGTLPDKFAKLDRQRDTYVICQTGHRSASAVRQLKRAGFEHPINVKGGMSAWRQKPGR